MFPEPLTVPTVPLASWMWVLGRTERTGVWGPSWVCTCPGEPSMARTDGAQAQSPGPQVRRAPGKGWDLAGQQARATAWAGVPATELVGVEELRLAPPAPQPGAPAQPGLGLDPGVRGLSRRPGHVPQLIGHIENLCRLGTSPCCVGTLRPYPWGNLLRPSSAPSKRAERGSGGHIS